MYVFVVCVCVYTNGLCALIYLIVFILKIVDVHQEKQEAVEGWYQL